jgi:AcrR family transcriptional regulator
MLGTGSVPSKPTVSGPRSRTGSPSGVVRGRNGAKANGAKANGARADGAKVAPFARTSELGREHVVEIQRARILGAMVEVSAERGAGNATVAHVVDRAGISRRTFYELFSDGEDCFIAAFDAGVARASQYALEGYDPAAKWDVRVRGALVGLLGFLDREPGAGRLLIVGSLEAGPGALEHRRGVLERIVAVVDEGREASKTGRGVAPLTAEGIVGGVLSVLHSRLSDSPSISTPASSSSSSSSATTPKSSARNNREGGAGGSGDDSLLGLTGSLMSMIVLPYLGPAAARRELAKPIPKIAAGTGRAGRSPLGELDMRLTYRTVRVLSAIAHRPGSSNRNLGDAAGIGDQGQVSKLLGRLQRLGLIENRGVGAVRGEPNSWTLTQAGDEVHDLIASV